MKKLLAVIIAVMLCAAACAPKETALDPVTPGTEGGQTASTEADDTGEFISEEDGKNINAMLPIMDSIVRSIGIDSDTKYDAKSDDLIWSVLYLTGVNWGMSIEPETAEPTVTTDEQEYVTVPASTMEDYAAAAFGGERSIPKIAASFAESVTFDDSAKAYRLAPSDMGDTIARIDSITPDGSAVKVSTGLYLGSGERLGGMVFTLEKCDTAGQFKYCVTAAVNENELGIYQWKDVKLNSEDSLSADGKADSVKFTVVQDKDGNVTVLRMSDENEINVPMVCLVNGATSSSAELFANALRKMGGATIVGTKTAGMGVVLSDVQSFSDGSAAYITSGLLLDNEDQSWNNEGLKPDIDATLSVDEQNSYYDYTIDTDPQISKAVNAATALAGQN
mgnify:CR=1 FL=1